MAAVFETPNDMLGTEGQTLGTSEWMEIDQDRVNMFADATGDHQWIHVDKEMAEQSPFGTTIAHGFLTLSLLPMLLFLRRVLILLDELALDIQWKNIKGFAGRLGIIVDAN